MKALSIQVRPYGGKDPKKRAEYINRISLARHIEQFIVDYMKGRTSAIVTYRAVAEAIGCSREVARELLQTVGGGENGITL